MLSNLSIKTPVFARIFGIFTQIPLSFFLSDTSLIYMCQKIGT